MPATRQIRKLRLRAPAEQQARRGLLLLEDALRTASLHDEGGRVVIMRKVHLGRFPSDAASQSVALALEQAVAELAVACVHGGSKPAGDAPAIWFRDATEAYTLLALRLLEGRSTDEWYWPLAVPEWTRPSSLTESLQQLGFALAARDDAPAALPHWVTAIADAGHAERLAESLAPHHLWGLAQAARLNAVSPVAADGLEHQTTYDQPSDPGRTLRAIPAGTMDLSAQAQWHSFLSAAYCALGRRPPNRLTQRTVQSAAPLPPRAHQQPTGRRGAARSGAATLSGDIGALASPADAERPLFPSRRSQQKKGATSADLLRNSSMDEGEPARASLPTYGEHTAEAPSYPRPEICGVTAAGGLLFLVRVLEHCGYRKWLEANPAWRRHDIAQRVFALILANLGVAADDPAWAVGSARPLRGGRLPHFRAPESWFNGIATPGPARWNGDLIAGRLWDNSDRLLIAAWDGPIPQGLAGLIPTAGTSPVGRPIRYDHIAVATAWANTCRRWLRHHARIGFADLILRQAELAYTSTHIDMRFELSSIDIRVRRTGLDLDPGWVSWLSRIVSFHYGHTRPVWS
ncbi:hypothetical protein [Methylotetracoccus oryzae]|uniref:hypothetical protein n=1 Tax=Methylotetracoccus oryzae TaxID=1919059 RepID=UPI001119EED2|nr:hypothetical protein [Methylotetracoccus oryzae]